MVNVSVGNISRAEVKET